MTWRKTGTEFDDECANVGLSDEAYRTHQEAIGFIYKIEADTCRFAKAALRRFATSERVTSAIKELLDHGFWREHPNQYEVCHHADVIRDSLHAQQAKRDRDRAAQRRAREKKEKGSSERDVSGDVSADTRQTDRQTDKHLETGPRDRLCMHGMSNGAEVDPWTKEALCDRCEENRKRTA